MRLLVKPVQALLVLEAISALYNALNKLKLNNIVNFDCAIYRAHAPVLIFIHKNSSFGKDD